MESAVASPALPPRFVLTSSRADPFCHGEWCRKCNGTGVYTLDGYYYDPCYCCAGKGWRSDWDHSLCISYAERHPFDWYCCSEFIGIAAVALSA